MNNTEIPDFSHGGSSPQLGDANALAFPSPLAAAWNNLDSLKLVLGSAPIAIAMVGPLGRILYANVKLEELFGYREEELINQPIEVLVPERFRVTHARYRNEYDRNPHLRPMGSGMDLAGRHKDGTEFPIEAGLSYVQLGGEMYVITTVVDVSRRKHAAELLEHRVEERTRELERRRQVSDGLRDILGVLNSDRSIDESLSYIAARACRLLNADASAIYRLQIEQDMLSAQASYGLPGDFPDTLSLGPGNPLLNVTTPTVTGGPLPAVTAERNRVTPPKVEHVDDQLRITALNTPNLARTQIEQGKTYYQTGLTVPLLIQEEMYGSLVLYYREPRSFSSEEMELAATVGDQTALAIENARLRTQVERTAVAAERSRIARDLHDSVTQTLFSAALIAEVLPRLWQRDVRESERRLDELRQLTRGALAEMRTLLLELRPATLEEVDIGELLRQLAEAFTGRARVPITLELEGDGALPPDVKIAFYHICQEALNNVAKHGRAGHANVRLARKAGYANLRVTDDGQGFVIDSVTPEHLGLTIMHERAEAIGARLQIESRLQHGTTVVVEWET